MVVERIVIEQPHGRSASAYSLSKRLFLGDWAMAQLWLFWVTPTLGAALAGLCYRALAAEPAEAQDEAVSVLAEA